LPKECEPVKLSIILPVIDETTSLRETVSVLLEDTKSVLEEIFVVVCKKTTPDAMAVCTDLAGQHPQLIKVRSQERRFLGGAMQDCFEWAQGTHVLMMASDLETDPACVKELVASARQGFDVVTATRWSRGGGFAGYGALRGCANWGFQQLIRLSFGTRLTDLTYGFRIFRADLVKKIVWEELKHPFLLETILKPLRLGCSVAEIPTTWQRRVEGISHNNFWQNFVYLRIAAKTRLRKKASFLRKGAIWQEV
jgi:glycosyltransferase involved in cell wall biosynthesis